MSNLWWLPLALLAILAARASAKRMKRKDRQREQAERAMLKQLNEYYTPGGLLDPNMPWYDAKADAQRKARAMAETNRHYRDQQ